MLILLPISGYASEVAGVKEEALSRAAAMESYASLPLYFISNEGQADRAVKFYEQGPGHSTFFTGKGLVLSLARGREARTVRLSFDGANKDARIGAEGPLGTRVNYFKGSDRTKWHTDVPAFRSVVYRDVYRNVDIKFYGNNRKVEHDVIVKAGGNPSDVRFSYDGVKSLSVRSDGSLEVALDDGVLVEEKPFIYQEIDGKKVPVKGGYRIIEKGPGGRASYGFVVGSYDAKRDLVIDPTLDYSTYLGGSAGDFGRDIAMDSSGAIYITGWTLSADFPTLTPVQGFNRGGILTGDAFVTKINSAGTAIVYSTFLGGSGDEDSITIAVDSTGAAYITGDTESMNFPVFNALQGAYGGGLKDAFAAKLSPAGNSLVFSTYLGGIGDDKGKGLALDSTGAIYLTGWTSSLNFPLKTPVQAALAGLKDAFVTKVNSAGTAIIYSTYLGGTNVDSGRAITVNSAGEAYVTGHSWSSNFPLKFPIQGTFGGIKDVVVFKLNSTGNALVFSTYFGGSGTEKSKGIVLNSNGAIYITGWTTSPDFPVVTPIQGALNGIQDGFLVKLAPPGRRILFSTYLGGSDSDSGRDITVDSAGNAYIAGHTWSFDYPLVNPLQGAFGGVRDAFVTKVDSNGTAILYSTYLGGEGDDSARGIVMDGAGAVRIIGGTDSINFPIVNPLQGVNAGVSDAFIARISDAGGPAVILSLLPDTSSVAAGASLGYTVTMVNTTAITQCVKYWENITLPGGAGYPTTGELFGPVNTCVNANSTQSSHLTKAVPLSAPLGTYVFHAFVGNPFPSVMDPASFNFNVTAFGPLTGSPNRSWRLLGNGLSR